MLSNEQKGGMSLLLALLSKDIHVNRYNIKKAKNISLYDITTDDGTINYRIDFSKEYDFDPMFRTLLQNLLIERMDSYIPNTEDLKDDNLALKKFTDATNSYIKKSPKSMEEYIELKALLQKLDDVSKILEDFNLNQRPNILNGEFAFLKMAEYLLKKVIIEKTETPEKVSPREMQRIIDEVSAEIANIKENSFKKVGEWGKNPVIEVTSELEKELARLLSIIIMNEDVKSSISVAPYHDNTMSIDYFLQNKEQTLFLHDRQSIVEDMESFKNEYYNYILSSHNMHDLTALDSELKEPFVYDAINFTPHCLDIISSYKTRFDSLNFRDERIMGAIVLNIISLLGGLKITEDLSQINSKSPEEIKRVFDDNYDLISKHPAIAFQSIKRLEKTHPLKNGLDTNISEILKNILGGNPPPNIKVVRADDFGSLMDSILKDMKDVPLDKLTDYIRKSEEDLRKNMPNISPLRFGDLPEMGPDGFPIIPEEDLYKSSRYDEEGNPKNDEEDEDIPDM